MKDVFQKMDFHNSAKVTYDEFNEIMKKEPNLLEIVEALNEGVTTHNTNSLQKKEKVVFQQKEKYQQNFDFTIKKIESSIQDLENILLKLELTESTQNMHLEPNKSLNFPKRGPEFGIYIKSLNFDHAEERFGLENTPSLRTEDLTEINEGIMNLEKKNLTSTENESFYFFIIFDCIKIEFE